MGGMYWPVLPSAWWHWWWHTVGSVTVWDHSCHPPTRLVRLWWDGIQGRWWCELYLSTTISFLSMFGHKCNTFTTIFARCWYCGDYKLNKHIFLSHHQAMAGIHRMHIWIGCAIVFACLNKNKRLVNFLLIFLICKYCTYIIVEFVSF